jgi:hypothetical protein
VEGGDRAVAAGGRRAHRYVWSVYALRDPSDLEAGAEPGEVAAALSRRPARGGNDHRALRALTVFG